MWCRRWDSNPHEVALTGFPGEYLLHGEVFAVSNERIVRLSSSAPARNSPRLG